MRGYKTIRAWMGVVSISFFILLVSSTVFAGDLSEYKKLAQYTIEQAQNGRIADVDDLIAKQAQLVQLGVDACNDYSKKHPKAKRILELVTSNAGSMKQLTLSEIEEKWHHGGELEKHGYTVKEDHFGDVGNLIDAVIHPATTYIALNHYKRDKKPEHLEQVVAELAEVLVHIQHLE